MFPAHLPLDQHELVRLHPALVLPLVVGVILNDEGLTVAVGVLQRGRHEVGRAVYGAVVAEREWPIVRCVLDRAPQVDDLESLGKELGGILSRQMAVDAGNRRFFRLVNVHPRDGLALVGSVLDLARTATPDS